MEDDCARASLMTDPDPYDTLGISVAATSEQIRSANLRLGRQVHSDAGGSDALFR
jgi:curved DNA-binding protein CbpA